MPSSVRRSFLLAAAATVLTVAVGFAQDALTSSTVSVVPHVIKYSGTLPQAPSAASVVEVKFALYATQSGGEPLWTETQQVAPVRGMQPRRLQGCHRRTFESLRLRGLPRCT